MEGGARIDRDEAMAENRREIGRRLAEDPGAPESFCVAGDRLDAALRAAAEAGGPAPRAAAAFMGTLAWAQPFCGANKYTAFLIGSYVMADAGLRLRLRGDDDIALMDLMLRAQEDREAPDAGAMAGILSLVEGAGRPGPAPAGRDALRAEVTGAASRLVGMLAREERPPGSAYAPGAAGPRLG